MNKRTFFIVTLLLTSLSGFCQIGTTDVAAPKLKKEVVVVFDSTKNFLGADNVFSYEGQLLFVLPRTKGLEKYGYYDFEPVKGNSTPNYSAFSV